MNIKILFLGLAALANAMAEAAKAFASTIGVESPEAAAAQPQPPAAGGEDTKPKRGRPAAQPKAEAPAGPTDEERFEANKTRIKPLVEGGQGADVKAVIGKYSKTGMKDIPADQQAAFEKDLEALSY